MGRARLLCLLLLLTIIVAFLPGLLDLRQSNGDSMTTAIAVGDSITYGTDASPITNGYAYLVAASKGWTLDNRGVGGAMLCDAFDRVLTETITDSTVVLGNYACNDHGSLGDSNTMDARVHDWQKELLAFAAWVTIPDADKVTAKGGDVSYTGTWTNSTVYGTNDTAKVASVVGAKASFNYTIADGRARVLYICYISPVTGEGQFKVTVNGVDEGT